MAGDARSALASPRSVVMTREAATRLFGADPALGETIVGALLCPSGACSHQAQVTDMAAKPDRAVQRFHLPDY